MTQIYALYGKSGTGKSHRAISIAYKYQVSMIIDDGLLIYKGKMVPGSISGKQEENRLKAVKRAIFDDPTYAANMKAHLNAIDPDKILIIGTSQHMINRIVENLDLKAPDVWIDIDEITSPEERKRATVHRRKGRHVVPLSPVEVSRFKLPLIDRLKLLITSKGKTKYLGEQSVVKPGFHSMGKIYIQEKALQDLAYYTLVHQLNCKHVKRINIASKPESDAPAVEVHTAFKFGEPLHVTGKKINEELKATLKQLSGLENLQVRMIITELDIPENLQHGQQ